MPGAPTRFIHNFFILFLSVLLSMLVMFEVMTHYDQDVRTATTPSATSGQQRKPSEFNRRSLPDLTPLYRANLFAIDLSLIVLAEALLIVLFVRFTVPAALVATLVIIFTMTSASDRLRTQLVPAFLSRFVTNRYATLTHTDMVLLILLSGLIMAFLVSVLVKQSGVEIPPSPPHKDASPPPPL